MHIKKIELLIWAVCTVLCRGQGATAYAVLDSVKKGVRVISGASAA